MTIKHPAGGLEAEPALYVNLRHVSCTFTPLGAVYDAHGPVVWVEFEEHTHLGI